MDKKELNNQDNSYKKPKMGRPKKYNESTHMILIQVPKSILKKLDINAKKKKQNRTEHVLELISLSVKLKKDATT